MILKRKLMEVQVVWAHGERPVSRVKRYVYFSSEPLLWTMLHYRIVIVQKLWFTGGTRTLVWIKE